MNRELRITEDGSHTIYLTDIDEPYHSIHGAIQESTHVFIEQGFRQVVRSPIHILEMGLGTGLNLLLTLAASENKGIKVFYHAVEKYPLKKEEYRELNYEKMIANVPRGTLKAIHESPWNKTFSLTESFQLFKEKADIRAMEPGDGFDLVYFDAFAPAKQPELWSDAVFSKVYCYMNRDALLVTYTSKSTVRRTMESCGFRVEKVPGPPGKREMIKAHRI